MARNRNSHETRKKILEVSKNLFLEKGFDNTSIKDIIDGLGGLTKGVIYHHFDSKYDILQTIISENNQEILNYNWRGNTGLEKIQNSLMDSFSNFEHQRLVYSASVSYTHLDVYKRQRQQRTAECVSLLVKRSKSSKGSPKPSVFHKRIMSSVFLC